MLYDSAAGKDWWLGCLAFCFGSAILIYMSQKVPRHRSSYKEKKERKKRQIISNVILKQIWLLNENIVMVYYSLFADLSKRSVCHIRCQSKWSIRCLETASAWCLDNAVTQSCLLLQSIWIYLTVEASSVVLVCFAFCHVDATVGPWIPLVWLRVSLCYWISSVQEPAFEVRTSPGFGSLCRVILGNMSWIPFRWSQTGRCSAGVLLTPANHKRVSCPQDQARAGWKQSIQILPRQHG